MHTKEDEITALLFIYLCTPAQIQALRGSLTWSQRNSGGPRNWIATSEELRNGGLGIEEMRGKEKIQFWDFATSRKDLHFLD
jgi:hypothetical protein